MTVAFHNTCNNFPVYVHKKERADFILPFQYILSISLTRCLFFCPSIYVASIQHNYFYFTEHSVALCKVFADNSIKLQEHFKLNTLSCKYSEKG